MFTLSFVELHKLIQNLGG